MAKKNNGKINISLVSRLWKIFETKGWQIDDTATNSFSPFNRFCELFRHLDSKEVNLLCNLTEHYLRVKLQDYSSTLSNALNLLPADHFRERSALYVLPLVAPQDENKNKSSHMIVSLFNDMDVKSNSRINWLDIFLKYKSTGLPSNIANDSKASILLVDDFIGTGETAVEALSHLKNVRNLLPNRVTILSLVAQERGVALLTGLGCCVVSAHVVGRGISDMYNEPEKTMHLDNMRKIETWLEVDSDFRLGFKGSEALVSVNRTPNNTFPIYWLKKKNETGVCIGAPFER